MITNVFCGCLTFNLDHFSQDECIVWCDESGMRYPNSICNSLSSGFVPHLVIYFGKYYKNLLLLLPKFVYTGVYQ